MTVLKPLNQNCKILPGHGDELARAAEAEGGDAGAVREHAQADPEGQRGGTQTAPGRNRRAPGRVNHIVKKSWFITNQSWTVAAGCVNLARERDFTQPWSN